MQQSLYEKNLQALFLVDPALASSLFSISENEKFEIFQGHDPIDINIINKQTHQYMYANPLLDLEHTVQNIEQYFSRYPVLFFYGIGNGIFYKLISSNKIHQHLVIFEPEIELIYIALNFIDIAEDLKNERIIIKISSNLTFGETLKLVYKKNIKPYVKLYDLNIHASFYEAYSEDIKTTNQLMLRAYNQMVISHGNDTKDALIGIEQHIHNLPQMLSSYKLRDLLKKHISETAIVISTGPSLGKQLPLLKKCAPYATLICIDASLPILQSYGIIPDIVVSMERVELTSKFFETLSQDVLNHTYFVVSSLTHRKTIQNLKHAKLILAMRPLSYMRYFDLPDFGYVGSGMSAANLGYQVAFLMKHRNIILIGQDLAYADDGKSHAQGHIFSETEIKQNDKDLLVTRYGGEGLIKTTFIWDMFRNFFEKDIEYTITQNVITYNCTEGGARIYGSKEKPFKEVIETIIQNIPKKSIHLKHVSKKISIQLFKYAYDKTEEMLQYGLTLKNEVEELFLTLMQEVELLEKHQQDNNFDAINYERLINISDKIDSIKTEVESLNFSKMYLDTVQSFIYHQELELAKILVENVETIQEKKVKLTKWILAHKFWLFSLAGGIDAELTAITRGRSSLIEICHKYNLLRQP